MLEEAFFIKHKLCVFYHLCLNNNYYIYQNSYEQIREAKIIIIKFLINFLISKII